MGRCIKSQTASSSLTWWSQGFHHVVLEIFRELTCTELPLCKSVMNLEPYIHSGPHEHHWASLCYNCRCTCIHCPWHCCQARLANCCESSLPGSLALGHWYSSRTSYILLFLAMVRRTSLYNPQGYGDCHAALTARLFFPLQIAWPSAVPRVGHPLTAEDEA